MEILFHKKFRKSYKKLNESQKNLVNQALLLFEENPFNPQLKNHKLHGKQKNYRSIAAGNDLRIIFKVFNNYVQVLMLDVGSHSQVYE